MKITVVKFAGYGIFSITSYAFISIFLMLFSFYLNASNHVLNFWPINLYQQYIYKITTRNIWQYQKHCVNVDPKNIYVPALGACEFSNIEFNSMLNFDEYGRLVPARPKREKMTGAAQPGIAVLGDSHAMGWGVNDEDTFSNILQANTVKPVYNLAVSSYGTRREIRRLVFSPLLDSVDTIIIQYCDNDLSENTTQIDFEAAAEAFSATLESSAEPSERTLTNHLAAIVTTHALERALTLPLRPFREQLLRVFGRKGGDFAPHYEAIRSVLMDNRTALADKRIIIFYSNAHGKKFRDFEQFGIKEMGNVTFVDLDIARDKYFILDDHLSVEGHRFVGRELAKLIN